MTSEEAKAIARAGDQVVKGLRDGLAAVNKNLVDMAASLRKLNEAVDKVSRNDDYWHPVFGPDGGVPGDDYDWVLVKIREIGSNDRPYSLPHIAEYRDDDQWWSQETNKPYGSEELPFEVRYWRPIPGDTHVDLYSNNQLVQRGHIYED